MWTSLPFFSIFFGLQSVKILVEVLIAGQQGNKLGLHFGNAQPVPDVRLALGYLVYPVACLSLILLGKSDRLVVNLQVISFMSIAQILVAALIELVQSEPFAPIHVKARTVLLEDDDMAPIEVTAADD